MKWCFQEVNADGSFTSVVNTLRSSQQRSLDYSMRDRATIIINYGRSRSVLIEDGVFTFPASALLAISSATTFFFPESEDLAIWQFDREFIEIDVCRGHNRQGQLPFYADAGPIFINVTPAGLCEFREIGKQCKRDMELSDDFQQGMLRFSFARLILQVLRVAKADKGDMFYLNEVRCDIFKAFSVLVEENFREQHQVKFYARALYRSPKTLTNLFAKRNCPAPSRFIQQRIIREAKVYLLQTGKSAKEVAYELGFLSEAHFSRFFKKKVGMTLSAFRNG